MEINGIVVGFSHDTDPRSKLIQFVTGGYWNHTWIEYTSEVWGGRWIAHASGDDGGVVKVPAERYLARKKRIKRYEILPDITPAIKSCRDFVGLPYDWKVIGNAGLLLLYRLLKNKNLLEYALRDTSKLTCSEFVATILHRSNIFPPEFVKNIMKAYGVYKDMDQIDPELTTPSDLEKLCLFSWECRLIENRDCL